MDYKLLLEEGKSDPVGRVNPDESPVVFSGEDEPLTPWNIVIV